MIFNKLKNIWIFLIIIAIYFCATGVDTMDEDASQYAIMSMEMKQTGNYLKVYELGKDYLDKPPFLFWTNSLSMHIFGINNFAFKFPSILFAILAIFSTYRLARVFYDEKVAWLSAIVLATCQATFLITNDIRTDTILMGWVITALWLLAEWSLSEKKKYFILASIAIGGGMITKGPIALFVPIFAFGSHWILQRNFKFLFNPIYLIGILIIGIILIPMSIGLYEQFDLHPEKIIEGKKNVSGLRFFYWTQSFGRITGESVWDNNAHFSFLFENLLWGMLPWSLFFIVATISDWIKIIKNKFLVGKSEEFITTGGIVLTYCSLGVSKYQLPHYIYVVLPLIAISTAKILYVIFWKNEIKSLKTVIVFLQILILTVLVSLPIIISIFVFPSLFKWCLITTIFSISVILIIVINKMINQKVFNISLALVMIINIFLSLAFYPKLLTYQSGNVIGRYIKENKIEKDNFVMYKYSGSARNIHFYANRIVHSVDTISKVKSNQYILTMDEGLQDLQLSKRRFKIVQHGTDFHVAILTSEFLNKETRNQNDVKYYLIKILE